MTPATQKFLNASLHKFPVELRPAVRQHILDGLAEPTIADISRRIDAALQKFAPRINAVVATAQKWGELRTCYIARR